MPRPLNGRVGRSAGVAEHRVAKHRFVRSLSRTTSTTRASALICVVALAIAGAPNVAGAQTSADSLAQTRSAIDNTANQWFAAQREAADLDLQIEARDQTITQAEHRVDHLRGIANARVVELYETNNQALAGVMGGDPLDVGRRAELINQANANGQLSIEAFETSISNLTARRNQLHAVRKTQARTVRELAGERETLDAELASLQLRSAKAAERTQLAATIRKSEETATTASPTRPALLDQSTPVAPPTTAPAEAQTPIAPQTSAAPPDSGEVSPHHDEPFLVCTRARESNGEYSVASGNGYYGAYQFSPTTWNVTAAHLGRLDLVGVLPSNASPYDQDEMAWSLYQWQGNSPWGGRC
jgi:peptidoglycan hydrolase CwlO-like protein